MNAAAEPATADMGPAFSDLFAYNQLETSRWKSWFEANPAALDIKVGGTTESVRQLVSHIFQAELFLSGQVTGEEFPRTAAARATTLDEIFALHEQASERVKRYMSSMTIDDLRTSQEFRFKPGFKVSKRKLLTQFFLHGVHHWAQVALLVRQAGYPSNGPHDFILSSAME